MRENWYQRLTNTAADTFFPLDHNDPRGTGERTVRVSVLGSFGDRQVVTVASRTYRKVLLDFW